MTKNIFFGHNGNKLIKNTLCNVSENFDWIFCSTKIIKQKEKPRTIYIKTDYMKKYYTEIEKINNDFILVSAASDICLELSNKEVYNKYLKLPNLKKWYGENMLTDNPKIDSLTVGFATHKPEYEKMLLSYSKQKNAGYFGVFCCWRDSHNDYKEFTERKELTKITNPLFTYYNQLSNEGFFERLLEYKFTLCPLGNGLDPAPRIIECLFLGSVPIVRYNKNSYRLYKDFPVLFIEDWRDINNELLESKGEELWIKLQVNDYRPHFLISNIIKRINSGV